MNHELTHSVPSKKRTTATAAVAGMALLVGCQSTPEKDHQIAAPRCEMPTTIPSADHLSEPYKSGLGQTLNSLSKAPKSRHSKTAPDRSKTDLPQTVYELTVPGTKASPETKTVRLGVVSRGRPVNLKNLVSLSTDIIARRPDGYIGYASQGVNHTNQGWEFTTGHLTEMTSAQTLTTTRYTMQPNGYACAYMQRIKDGAESVTEAAVVHTPKDATNIGYTALAGMVRNAGAMQHPTPGFMSNQVLPEMSGDFWTAMHVEEPPHQQVQPLGGGAVTALAGLQVHGLR